jgi:tetratricopeptide (TPR) repeat protein
LMFYDIHGWFEKGFSHLDRAVVALEAVNHRTALSRPEQVALGHLLVCHGFLAFRLSQHEQAQTTLQRSLEILRPLNEPHVLVEAITFLAVVIELTGNYAQAFDLYSEGLEIATTIVDRWYEALCRTCLAGLARFTDITVEPEIAHQRLQSIVAEWRLIGDPRFTVIGLNNLSLSALRLDRYDEARLALKESLALSLSIGDRWGLGYSYRGLGIIDQVLDEHIQAVDMFRKSLDTLSELGARQDVARVLAEMGRSIFALGNQAEAGQVWSESLRLAIETKGMFIELEALIGLASLKIKQGDFEQALEWVLIVLNHPASLKETRERAAILYKGLEGQLSSQQVEATQIRVQSKTFDAVVDEILNLSSAHKLVT